MSLRIRSTVKVKTVEIDLVDTYAIIENDDFMYFVNTDVVEEFGLNDGDTLNKPMINVFGYADYVIRKSDKIVTKSRTF